MKHAAIQCGFCTPGMVMAAKALLDREPRADDAPRCARRSRGTSAACTGYQQIVDAVMAAAAAMKAGDARIEGNRSKGRGAMLEGFVSYPEAFVKLYREKGLWVDKTIGEELDGAVARYGDRVRAGLRRPVRHIPGAWRERRRGSPSTS